MKKLTLIPIGGLANRIYAITSAIGFCKDYNIKLKVIWFKDKGMGADFHSLFQLSEDVDKSNVEVIDAKWYHYIYDRPRKRNLWLPWLWQLLKYDVRYYESDISNFNLDFLIHLIEYNRSIYIVYCSPFYLQKFKAYLLPLGLISQKVNNIINRFPNKNNVIGIHIRRSDNTISITKSPLELFVQAIDSELAIDPFCCFYVASDSLDDKIKLKKKYGEHIYTSFEVVSRNNLSGIVDALIDLYVLSNTKRIYGSAYSSFSTLASEISGIQIKVLSL